tara:strand:- start:1006 stop:1155 length:150 start_codon:yes stop_codon:yes gene_type:complete
MVLKNRQKVEGDGNSNEPKVALSFHSHRLKYYGAVYLLIILIIFVNFGE